MEKWEENSKFILEKLESMERKILSMDDKIVYLTISVAKLNIKSGVWGLIGGAIPVFIWMFFTFLKL